ncbi:MAG: carboxypeptidase-like regulatory domain-containing protein, partial [Ginsengibacter sp.]
MTRILPSGFGSKMKYTFCLFTLSLFSYYTLLAGDKDLPVKGVEEHFFIDGDGLYNFLDIAITGKISDEYGNAIRGANVLEKGTSNGTVSDERGNFTLRVKGENSVLIFSSVSYVSQEIPVGSSRVVNVTMELTSKKLDEVVVVGYGTKRKSELTNAVVQTTGTELKKSNAISLSNSLSGRLAGLYVNQRS